MIVSQLAICEACRDGSCNRCCNFKRRKARHNMTLDLLNMTRRHCRRAEIRKAMAKHLRERIERLGWLVRTDSALFPREIDVYFSNDDYRASVSFDASGYPHFVLSWYTGVDRNVVYPKNFLAGEVNTYHFQKATTIARTFGELCTKVENGIDQLRTLSEAK
jgi:hypothetical protein